MICIARMLVALATGAECSNYFSCPCIVHCCTRKAAPRALDSWRTKTINTKNSCAIAVTQRESLVYSLVVQLPGSAVELQLQVQCLAPVPITPQYSCSAAARWSADINRVLGSLQIPVSIMHIYQVQYQVCISRCSTYPFRPLRRKKWKKKKRRKQKGDYSIDLRKQPLLPDLWTTQHLTPPINLLVHDRHVRCVAVLERLMTLLTLHGWSYILTCHFLGRSTRVSKRPTD